MSNPGAQNAQQSTASSFQTQIAMGGTPSQTEGNNINAMYLVNSDGVVPKFMPNLVTGGNKSAFDMGFQGADINELIKINGGVGAFLVIQTDDNVLSVFDGSTFRPFGIAHEGFDYNSLGNIDLKTAASISSNLNAKVPSFNSSQQGQAAAAA